MGRRSWSFYFLTRVAALTVAPPQPHHRHVIAERPTRVHSADAGAVRSCKTRYSAAGARAPSILMVNVNIENERVIFDVLGMHQLWALRSRLEIPLAHVIGADHDPEQVGRWWHGWKLIGSDLPGIFAAGTFYYHGELVFWDVRDPERTVVVSLSDERYKKLIIEVDDPDLVVERLRAAIRSRK